MDGGLVPLHGPREQPAPVFLVMISTAPKFTSITSIGLCMMSWAHDEADTVKLPDVGVPPEYIQLHVLADLHLVVLLTEGLQARQKATEEAP